MNFENAKKYVRENKARVALVTILAVLAVVVLIVLMIVFLKPDADDGTGTDTGTDTGGSVLYSSPEVFQVSVAGRGYGDGSSVFLDGASVAADLGSRFGTTYQTVNRASIQSSTSGTNGQWCNYGWTEGETWPYCQSAPGSDTTCCNGSLGTADWEGMNPQPAVFLYGQKPKAGQIPTCDTPGLAAGTQCISNWSAGGGLPTVYSRYD